MEAITILVDDNFRLKLITAVINELEASSDPRAPAALEEYRAQLATVQARLNAAALADGNPAPVAVDPNKPPAQVVRMATLGMRSEVASFA